MGVILFCKYMSHMVNTFVDVTNPNDLLLSLGLYVIYPAILWLLIDKFHGICGVDTYQQKSDAISACNSLFLLFTSLLRTYKFLHLVRFSVDAEAKEGSQRSLNTGDDDDSDRRPSRSPASGGLFGKLKCQIWMHLSHELAAVGFVAFLLIVCLPVLAFWFMFLSIVTSLYNLYRLFRRMWHDSQEGVRRGGGDYSDDEDEEGGDNDLEFQEFLSNFGEEDDNKD